MWKSLESSTKKMRIKPSKEMLEGHLTLCRVVSISTPVFLAFEAITAIFWLDSSTVLLFGDLIGIVKICLPDVEFIATYRQHIALNSYHYGVGIRYVVMNEFGYEKSV